MMGTERLNYEVGAQPDVMCYGGIGAVHRLVTKLGLPKTIDASLELLKVHLPYHESDHVLKIGAIYRGDLRVGQFLSAVASLAILIASLGVVGLASFDTGQREREIGIRRALGATRRAASGSPSARTRRSRSGEGTDPPHLVRGPFVGLRTAKGRQTPN